MMTKFSRTQSHNLLTRSFVLLDGEEHGNMALKRPCIPKTLHNSRELWGQKKMWLFKDTQYGNSNVPPGNCTNVWNTRITFCTSATLRWTRRAYHCKSHLSLSLSLSLSLPPPSPGPMVVMTVENDVDEFDSFIFDAISCYGAWWR